MSNHNSFGFKPQWHESGQVKTAVHIKFEFKAGKGSNNIIRFRSGRFDIVPGKPPAQDVKEGEWTTYELIADGDQVEQKINGVRARNIQNTRAKPSPLILQGFGGEFEVKNIRVKE